MADVLVVCGKFGSFGFNVEGSPLRRFLQVNGGRRVRRMGTCVATMREVTSGMAGRSGVVIEVEKCKVVRGRRRIHLSIFPVSGRAAW